MNDTIYLALLVVALILAAVDVVRSKGQSLTAWAVVIISIALLLTTTVLK